MKRYILMTTVFFSIGISGCKKNYLSLEVNPNQPSVSPPGITLAAALNVAAAIVNQSYAEYGSWIGYWTNSGNFVPNTALDEFLITDITYTGVSTGLYQNLTNFNNLQTVAAKDPTLKSYQAIAMIMKVYDFQQLVDQFGDVAYSQAFQPSTILNPAYDNQQAIYNDLVKQLDAAIALIGAGNPSPAGDIVFAANGAGMTGWAKFANTLKLRLAIRQSNVAGNTAKADLAATSAVGYLDRTTDAEANPGYANTLSGSNSQQSPFWANFGFDVNGNSTFPNTYERGNKFYIATLTNFNDPRLNQIYAPAVGTGTAGGNTFGDNTASVASNTNTSAIGPGLLISYSMNAVLMNSAEALFLQSEAALNGWIPGNPQTLYEAGITASFQAMGLTAGQATTYYTQAIKNVGWVASAANEQEAIIYQKWIALTGYSNLEAFLEFQRTGFPVLPNPLSADPSALSPTAPKRQFYPLSELTSNSASVGKEGTINIFTTKIFWEK